MILLLSGATHKDAQQLDLNRSLGGLVSSTPVPNGRMNGLFSDVSNYTVANNSSEIVGIFLVNNTSNDLANLSIQEIYEDDNICEFEFAVVSVTDSGAMELIGSKFEEPYYANWFEPIDKTLIKEIFKSGEMIGLWIKRTIIKESEEVSECLPADSVNKNIDECLEVIFSHD